jgi:hypothetical protein
MSNPIVSDAFRLIMETHTSDSHLHIRMCFRSTAVVHKIDNPEIAGHCEKHPVCDTDS